MSEQKPDRKGRELLDAINHLLSEVDPETPEEIEAVIEGVGYDADSFAARMKVIAEQAMTESPLNWRNKARAELEQERRRLESRSTKRPNGREELLARVRALSERFAGKSDLAFAHHRNLDQASEEDLLSLVEELEHLLELDASATDGI